MARENNKNAIYAQFEETDSLQCFTRQVRSF